MKKHPTLYVLLLLCIATLVSTSVSAQFTIKGQVTDTSSINEVDRTSIVIIGAQDSIIKTYKRSDDDGHFSLQVKEAGDYILIANHPVFAIYTEKISVKEPITDLGKITLYTKAELMETVMFSDARSIMIKGDTTIYAADSFLVRQYATVDELLKKLPGIEVSKDGQIKAYGKNVQKMYVDGEEFFSDDPSVVAKTLQASSIDKVKVYDDKSENAKKTGVEDGELVKTINLTLKDNAKKGVTGSLFAGAAPQNYHEYAAKLQAFTNKQKIAAYFTGGTTNRSLMSWEDGRNFGTYGDITENDDGNFSMTNYDFSEDNGGLPEKRQAGLNYSNKFFDDKWKFNTSYGYNNKKLNRTNNNVVRYIMPDTQYVNEFNSNSNNQSISNRIKVGNNIEIDSNKTLAINFFYRQTDQENNAENQSIYKDAIGTVLNRSTTENKNKTKSSNTDVSVYYNQKLKKKGRSFNIGGAYSNNYAEESGTLVSKNELLVLDSTILFNQRKSNVTSSQNYSGSAAYTEPLYKEKLFLELNYRIQRIENNNDLRTFDQDGTNEEVYNSNFSNDYSFHRTSHTGGLNLRYNEKKLRSSIGIRANNTEFEQINRIHSILNRTYSNFNLFPRASFNYNINTSSSVGLNYNGNTIQPTIDQLQPLVIITDPTNIRIGNDALKQAFSNRVSVNYNTYSVLKNTYAYMSLNYTNTINPISQSQTLNESGIREFQYVNAKNSSNVSFWGIYSKKLTSELRGDVRANLSRGSNYSWNNGVEAKNTYYDISPAVSLSYELDTTISTSISFSPSYNNSYTSIRPDINNHFWTYNTSFDIDYTLPWNIVFNTNISWILRPQLDKNLPGKSVAMWNASLTKSLLKDKSLQASLYCYDILNQNVGFSFNQTGISTSESSWNVVRQYFLVGLKWNFDSMKKKRKVDAPAVDELILE